MGVAVRFLVSIVVLVYTQDLGTHAQSDELRVCEATGTHFEVRQEEFTWEMARDAEQPEKKVNDDTYFGYLAAITSIAELDCAREELERVMDTWNENVWIGFRFADKWIFDCGDCPENGTDVPEQMPSNSSFWDSTRTDFGTCGSLSPPVNEFGFRLDSSNCTYNQSYLVEYELVLPTPAPTSVPTLVPTPISTAVPTDAPTNVPTSSPMPTPTAMPSPEQTAAPTHPPTPEPSAAPTASPTPEATLEPTAEPSLEPTAAPTPLQTNPPSPAPSPVATPSPTSIPTSSPSQAPTLSPTSAPTPVPTPWPTPIASPQPTLVPTPDITSRPSPASTAMPTNFSTVAPTPITTATPTPIGTAVPTPISTAVPTPTPTTPSTSVTEAPTTPRVTRTPTSAPSSPPTLAPTWALTPVPTSFPVVNETRRPSVDGGLSAGESPDDGGVSPIIIAGVVIAVGGIATVTCLALYWHHRSNSKRYESKKLAFRTVPSGGRPHGNGHGSGPHRPRTHHSSSSSRSGSRSSRDLVMGHHKAMYSPAGGSTPRPPCSTEMVSFGRLDPPVSPSASSRSASRSISSRLSGSKRSFSISFQKRIKGPNQRPPSSGNINALEMSNMAPAASADASRATTRERASSVDSVISTLSEVAEMSDSSMEGV